MTSPAARKERPRLPSVDAVMRSPDVTRAEPLFGRPALLRAVRETLSQARAAHRNEEADQIAALTLERLHQHARPRLRPVYNLTGTVLHTNLGRAVLAEAAIKAAVSVMRSPATLEYDLASGGRGERDDVLRDLICELTGAEDATVVNNNAAAVFLALNTFGCGRESIVSRGELIEIGGSFRMPEIMARAGTRLVEVGTTNRTHLNDYAAAAGDSTGLIVKVHTSNYRIQGFTTSVTARELALLARSRGIPLLNDLGAGTLIDLGPFGLAHEPTVAEAIAGGCDLVTFSGDKLLGGPQAGFITGRRDLIAEINKNPIKRALRLDKIRLAALEATLQLYRHPATLGEQLPTLKALGRPIDEIARVAERLLAPVGAALEAWGAVEQIACQSQIGSGSMPLETLPSAGLAIRLHDNTSSAAALAAAWRRLPIPVIGRIERNAFVLDLRCLEDEAGFLDNVANFPLPDAADALA